MKKRIKIIIATLTMIVISFIIIERVVFVSIAKDAIRYIVKLETHMDSVKLNPIKGCLTINGFRIFNPREYKDRILAKVPKIIVDIKPETLFKKGTYIDRIVIHISQINIIRDKDGIVNLSQMKALTPKEESEQKEPFLVDRYTVEVEKVRYIDYTKEEDDRVRDIDLNIKEEYKGVKNPDNIAKIIAYKVFFNGQLGNIGVDIQKIQKDLAKLAEENEKLAGEMAKVMQEKIENAKEAVKEAVEKTTETVKEKVEQTKVAIGEKIDSIKDELENTDTK